MNHFDSCNIMLYLIMLNFYIPQMMGKSLLGPVTDLIGGDATMQITMAIITVLMYACAVSTSIQVILSVTQQLSVA